MKVSHSHNAESVARLQNTAWPATIQFQHGRTRTHFLDAYAKILVKLHLLSQLDYFDFFLHSRGLTHKHVGNCTIIRLRRAPT